MAVLENIVVAEADLLKVRPDIGRYLQFEGQTLDDVIATVKRAVYREVKAHEMNLYPGYLDAQIEARLVDVKDYANEEALKDRIVLLTVADIMAANGLTDDAELYVRRARQIPLHYWVDTDKDETISESERRSRRKVVFGR